MVRKRNSKWRPSPSWIYFRWLFLKNCRLSTVDRNHLTKFRANISIYDWIIITFVYSRWRPSAMLDFRKIPNWPNIALECWFPITMPNLVQKCWSTPALWPKNEIQNGGRRHLEFTSGGYFWHRADFTLLISTTTQNFVLISQSAADNVTFQNSRRRPSAILELFYVHIKPSTKPLW